MKALIQSYNKESGKCVLHACIPFILLKEKCKFTFRARPEADVNADLEEGESSKYYQRQLNLEHLKEIKRYLASTILSEMNGKRIDAIFPTSVLIAYSSDDIRMEDNEEVLEIDIPDGVYVVDGQHRLKAMIDLYNGVTPPSHILMDGNKRVKAYLERYKFNCTILVNYDLWEQARIFADVNFKQKKVSKSLYYEIYGMNYSEDPLQWKQNAVYLAHSLVAFLNGNKLSPIRGNVKMLGSKDKGFISQSFLVEALLRHISSPRGIWYFDPMRTKVDKALLIGMAVEILSYLSVVHHVFGDLWPSSEDKHTSIICKTTGMGALLRLMGDIHRVLPANIFDSIKSKEFIGIDNDYVETVTTIIEKLKPQEARLFSIEKNVGQYNGTGGKGLEGALYKEMKTLLDLDK